MNLIEDIVSNGHGWLDPSYVVIHETANPGATARNHRDYWAGNDLYAVHYVGDWTGDVYHCVPDNRLCNQVGNGNPYVVGIELCHAESQEDFEAVWKVGVEWAAMMLNRHDWGIDRLISHYDCTIWWGGSDHTDPIGYFEEYGKSWGEFVDAVERKMAGEEEEEMQPVSNEGGSVFRLYNPNTGFHHYTTDAGEKDSLMGAGWRFEGEAWRAKASQRHAVYRMYNPGNGDHLLTTGYGEAKALEKAGWKYEGVPFFASDDGVEVYRMYNPNSGEHFFTASLSEAESLQGAGWKREGVAFRA